MKTIFSFKKNYYYFFFILLFVFSCKKETKNSTEGSPKPPIEVIDPILEAKIQAKIKEINDFLAEQNQILTENDQKNIYFIPGFELKQSELLEGLEIFLSEIQEEEADLEKLVINPLKMIAKIQTTQNLEALFIQEVNATKINVLNLRQLKQVAYTQKELKNILLNLSKEKTDRPTILADIEMILMDQISKISVNDAIALLKKEANIDEKNTFAAKNAERFLKEVKENFDENYTYAQEILRTYYLDEEQKPVLEHIQQTIQIGLEQKNTADLYPLVLEIFAPQLKPIYLTLLEKVGEQKLDALFLESKKTLALNTKNTPIVLVIGLENELITALSVLDNVTKKALEEAEMDENVIFDLIGKLAQIDKKDLTLEKTQKNLVKLKEKIALYASSYLSGDLKEWEKAIADFNALIDRILASVWQLIEEDGLHNEGNFVEVELDPIINENIKHFKANPKGYEHTQKPQLPNYDLTEWKNSGLYSGTSALNNHPAFFSSPRYASTPSNGSYALNTLYSITDSKGEYLLETEGQFGKSIKMISKAAAALGIIPAIPGQLTNVRIMADGTSNPEKIGFIMTDPNGLTSNGNTWPTATEFKARPDFLVVYYQYDPKGNDQAVFEVMLHNAPATTGNLAARLPAQYEAHKDGYKAVDENVVGYGKVIVQACNTGNWCRAKVPIYYREANLLPDYVVLNMTSSDMVNKTLQGGSALTLDRMVFEYQKYELVEASSK